MQQCEYSSIALNAGTTIQKMLIQMCAATRGHKGEMKIKCRSQLSSTLGSRQRGQENMFSLNALFMFV